MKIHKSRDIKRSKHVLEWRPDPGWPDGRVWDLYNNGMRITFAYVGKDSAHFGHDVFASRTSGTQYGFTDLRDAARWVEKAYR